MKTAEANVNEMHDMVNKMLKMRKQLKGLSKDITDASLKQEAKALIQQMKDWDEHMIQRKSKAYDDVENFKNKFTANYLFAINHAESDIPKVNQATKDRMALLDAKWAAYKSEGKQILKTAIPALNQKLWEAGMGAIWTAK